MKEARDYLLSLDKRLLAELAIDVLKDVIIDHGMMPTSALVMEDAGTRLQSIRDRPKMGGVPMDVVTIDEAQDFLAPGEVYKFSEPEYVGKFVDLDPMKTKDKGVNKLKRGIVWCKTCGRSEKVDPVYCLDNGWPQCCGQTMTLDSPEERNG